jgi:thioredoxin reductase (NADPH)
MRLVITQHPVSGREIQSGTLPAHLWPKLRNPTETELARCLGLISPLDPARLYDVTVVGAEPTGLSSAVYAASEGFTVGRASPPALV